MFGHLPELVIVLILGLIFFGPEKLPEIAGSAGKMVGELRAAFDTAMQPDQEIDDDEFSTYYYDAMHRSGDLDADFELDEVDDPGDGGEQTESDEVDEFAGADVSQPDVDQGHSVEPHQTLPA